MFNKIKIAIIRFMQGRYGSDKLNRTLFWTYLALIVINFFTSSILNMVIATLQLFIAVVIIYRTLSKNIYKRSAENRKYMVFEEKIKNFFKLQKSKFRDRNTHVYKKCPYCKAVLRLPKKSGEHRVDCPKCKKEFKVKI